MKQEKLEEFYNEILIAVNSAHGVYIPSIAIERYRSYITNAAELKEALDFVQDDGNRDHEDYIDFWIEITDNAVLKNENGREYQFMYNEDLWLVPVDIEVPEDWII